MIEITDEVFDAVITQAMDELPQEYIRNLNNVAILIADEPTDQQRKQLKLHCNQLLFGLYEGIPLTRRGTGLTVAPPDKITLFKIPLLLKSRDMSDFKENVKRTLWHEMAHHFGLNHEQIHKLEQQKRS